VPAFFLGRDGARPSISEEAGLAFGKADPPPPRGHPERKLHQAGCLRAKSAWKANFHSARTIHRGAISDRALPGGNQMRAIARIVVRRSIRVKGVCLTRLRAG
jgi:hypothetical protein